MDNGKLGFNSLASPSVSSYCALIKLQEQSLPNSDKDALVWSVD